MFFHVVGTEKCQAMTKELKLRKRHEMALAALGSQLMKLSCLRVILTSDLFEFAFYLQYQNHVASQMPNRRAPETRDLER